MIDSRQAQLWPAMSEQGFYPASRMVEAGGIEPPSEGHLSAMTTCLAVNLISLFEPPTAGFLKLSGLDFGLSPSGRGIGLSH